MMRKYIYSIFFVASIFAGCSSAKELTVLHTNDTHSQILPFSKNLADTMIADRGGFIRRINMLKQERAADPELLLFDSGDFSQGSTYYSMYKGDVETGLMNMMHYDAGTIGNHEFDFGLDNMARLFKKLNFPIVCSNYDFTGTSLEGVVKPYTILHRKGLKIGVFALCTKMDGLVDKKVYFPYVSLITNMFSFNEFSSGNCKILYSPLLYRRISPSVTSFGNLSISFRLGYTRL